MCVPTRARRAQGQELVAFERYMALRKSGGNHCHVNVLPIPAAAAAGARKVRLLGQCIIILPVCAGREVWTLASTHVLVP